MSDETTPATEAVEARDRFTFFRSFFDAAEYVPPEARLEYYETLIRFGLFGEEPERVNPAYGQAWLNARPVLSKGRVRAAVGRKGGEGNAGNPRPWQSKPKANPKQDESKPKGIGIGEGIGEGEGSGGNPGGVAAVPSPSSKSKANAEAVAAFESFWAAWPRKVARKGALRAWAAAWKSGTISAATLPAILDAVRRAAASKDWTDEGGRFIPHAATWIKGERWNDAPTPATATPPVAEMQHTVPAIWAARDSGGW